MASYSVTFALGVDESGKARREAWQKAAVKESGDTRGALNQWAKKHLDKAAGFNEKALGGAKNK